MSGWADFFHNSVLWCGFCGWFAAQLLKVLIYWRLEKHFSMDRFWGSGGMPSSHTSCIVSTTIMIGGTQGFGSPLFALAMIVASIVMYDAVGVRRETGNQAQAINMIMKNIFIDGKPASEEELKELIGHTPLEMIGGALLGIVVSSIFLYFGA